MNYNNLPWRIFGIWNDGERMEYSERFRTRAEADAEANRWRGIKKAEGKFLEKVELVRVAFHPFRAVCGKYGAPMGRMSDPPHAFEPGAVLYARHQGGGDGYDSGGAYWGTPGDVWCVWTRGGEAVTYVRARSKGDAIQQVRILIAELAA